MAPTWLTVIAWVYIGICFTCAGVIAYDIVIAGRRQPMAVMNWVFPITALYFGPFALALYWRWARVSAHRRRPHVERSRPGWASMAIEVSHCGSGCTVGDLISEWVIYALGLAIAGRVLFAEYVGDYVLAVAFGIVFQYFAIAPMRGLGVRDGVTAAAKADFISLTFFEIGLFGWMALMAFVSDAGSRSRCDGRSRSGSGHRARPGDDQPGLVGSHDQLGAVARFEL